MKPLKHILRKIEAIRFGMLRSKDGHKQVSLQVEAMTGGESCSDWLLAEDTPAKFLNKQVTLIQKQENDYIYITGKVAGQRTASGTVLSIRILRACWMVRKSKGNLTWLDEKYIYDLEESLLKIAS